MRTKLIKFRGERSQDEMAKIYGVTQQTWSNWERATKTPSPSIMKQIEIDSGIPMEELFFDAFDNLRLFKETGHPVSGGAA